MSSRPEQESLIEYPCEMVIKVIGVATVAFEASASEIIKKQCHDYTLKKNTSREAKYIALSYTVMAKSKEQMDAVYQRLTQLDGVSMVL